MTDWAIDGKLLLSFAWAVPLSPEDSGRMFEQGLAGGLLKPLDGRLGKEWAAAEEFLFTRAQSA